MKLVLCLFIVSLPIHYGWSAKSKSSKIFHLSKEKGECIWKLYDINADTDKNYYKTKICPNQIVWLKDKSFYYSIKTKIFWGKKGVKKPVEIVDYRSARKGHSAQSEVIWGVRGKYNSVYTLVTDPQIKKVTERGQDYYRYQDELLDPKSFEGDATEPKAAGVMKRWLKSKKKWKTISYKLTGRFNNTKYDPDLYNMSTLSSRQIILYNECSDSNCEKLPSESSRTLASWENKLKLIDDGVESMGYLELEKGKGILFKKVFGETLHPARPFMLCENDCKEMTEVELPKSFSDNFALVKKGEHLLVFNEDKGSIGSLYSFNSTKPIKEFRGPMVFWHPF